MAQNNFWDSLLLGNEGEKAAEDLFKFLKEVSCLIDWQRTPHWVYQHLDFDGEHDYIWLTKDKKTKGVEVKCLAGGKDKVRYSTGVVEVWKDNEKTCRPNWWKMQEKEKMHFIFFVNRFDQKVYCFSTKKLKDWAEKSNPNLTRCNNGNSADKGWIVKFGWEDSDKGWLSTWAKEGDEWKRLK